MIQVKMCDDDAVDVRRDGTFWHNVREVRKAPFIIEAHVHATIQHDIFTANRQQNTASTIKY